MTQDSPNQSNPENPRNSEKQRNSRPQETPSFFKRQTIKLLRETIAILEGTLEKLEAEPTAPLLPPLPNSWRRVLRPIRIVIPASINRKISDWGLTGVIAGLSILVVSTAIGLSPANPTEPVAQLPPQEIREIAETPPSEPTETVTEIPELDRPTMTETPPEETDLPPLFPPVEEPETFEESDEPIIAEPPPDSSETILEEPEFNNLTPEELLIASIQEKVVEVTREYTDGMIESVQGNFRSSKLQVNVSNDWYTLSKSNQKKLANKMLKQAQELDFRTVEMFDSTKNLVARSPVVGSQMIILRSISSL